MMLERIDQHGIAHHYGDIATARGGGQGCREAGHGAHTGRRESQETCLGVRGNLTGVAYAELN